MTPLASIVLCAAAAFGLTTEYQVEPVGLDVAKPRLGWKLPADVTWQTAYEIKSGDWTSGKVPGDRQVGVEWPGRPLEPSARVTWQVRVWDEKDRPSAWSAPARFTTGLMKPSGWKAKWIAQNLSTCPDEDMKGAQWITGPTNAQGAVVLRKRFSFAGAKRGECVELVEAVRPHHRIFINGRNALNYNYMSGTWTWNYLRFRDITGWLRKGENEIRIEIISDRSGHVDDSVFAFLAKIVLPDGSTVVTDKSWEGATEELGGPRERDWNKCLVMRTENRSPAFEKAFEVTKDVRRATLHITGLGFYEATLNGERIGQKVLDPKPTDYNKRVYYSTYELDGKVRKGLNRLNVLVGHGWYDVRAVAAWDHITAPWRDVPKMIAQLEIEYADGLRETVVSDKSWRQVDSPVAFDCIRECEVVKGALEKIDLPVREVNGPRGALEAEPCSGAKVQRLVKPEWVRFVGDKWIVKFPENLAGWARIRFPGKELPGQVVSIRYDERLNADGTPAAPSDRGGLVKNVAGNYLEVLGPNEQKRYIDGHFYYTASHRACPVDAAFQCDRYICRGESGETYEPRFTYNGFQYLVISGLTTFLTADDVVACVVHTDFESGSSFTCSDATLNTLMKMADRSYRSNFVDGYPTDCPHREKNGWGCDAAVVAELAQYAYENTMGYEAWLRDVCDTQLDNGLLCAMAPTPGFGYGPRFAGPGWESPIPLIGWNLLVYRDDERIVRETYPVYRRFMLDFMEKEEDADGLVKRGLGDWIPPDKANAATPEFATSAWYFFEKALCAKIADRLGIKKDAAHFRASAGKTRRGVYRRFYRGEGVFDNGSQSAQTLALGTGVAERGDIPALEANFLDCVRKDGLHFSGGMMASKFFWRELTRLGHADWAFESLVTRQAPSFAEWIDRGATTLWEDWTEGWSRNHIMFGSYVTWAYQDLAGIRPSETKGFREMTFKPSVIPQLSNVTARIETPYGTVGSAWTREGGHIRYRFTVPSGCRATVAVPGLRTETLGPGEHRRTVIAAPEEISEVKAVVKPGAPIETAVAGSNGWVVIDNERDIVKGSALDFSGWGLLDGPAGKYGRLVARNGHFEFERKPGVRQRFYGENVCMGALFPSDEKQVDCLLTRFERLGYNTFRIHHYDYLVDDGRQGLKADAIDRLDRLVAEAGKRGFYLSTDLFTIRTPKWRDCGIDREGTVPWTAYKLLIGFHEGAYGDWERFARQMMTHRNPYNGLTWAEDPAIAFVCLVNEGVSPVLNGMVKEIADEPILLEAWGKWLTAKRAVEPDYGAGLSCDRFPRRGHDEAGVAFVSEMENRLAARQVKFLRELGYKGLVTSNNNGGRDFTAMQRAAVANYDYRDTHAYHDHCGKIPNMPPYTPPQVYPITNPFAELDLSMTRGAFERIPGLPFTMTEFTFPIPSPFRNAGLLMFGALASLQDWDGLWHFAYSHRSEPKSVGVPGGYDTARDVLGLMAERMNIAVFLRGDLKPLTDGIAFDLSGADWRKHPQKLAWRAAPSAVLGEWGWGDAAWKTKVGSALGPVEGWRTMAREKAELPSGMAVLETLAASPSFQVVREIPDNPHLRLVTARTCAGYSAKVCDLMTAGPLSFRISQARAAVACTSLDGERLERSGRILLTHLTDSIGEGARWVEAVPQPVGSGRYMPAVVLLDWGWGRTLVRDGGADIGLALESPEKYGVWALSTSGRRLEELPTEVSGGKLRFRAQVKGPDGKGRLAYEIVRGK